MTASQDIGTPAREPIRVEGHLGLVHSYLNRRRDLCSRAVLGNALDYSDLVQAGLLAVQRAAETYDETRAAFSTYAYHWMRQGIGREIENNARPVRTPIHVQASRRKRGERPRPYCASLDRPLGDPEGETFLDGMPSDTPTPDALEAREAEDRAQLLAELLDAAKLTERERGILRERTVNGRTYVGTSEALGLGLSRERIRQLEQNALRKLRLAALRLAREGVEL